MAKCNQVIIVAKRKEEDTKEFRELRSKISFNIRKYRKEQHLTQEELSDRANISHDFMRRIEGTKGECGFSVYTLYKLSLALNISMDRLAEIDIPKYIEENKSKILDVK